MSGSGVRRVRPTRRFRVRKYGRRIEGDRSLLFEGRSHYYHCPECGRRTLVRWRELDVQPSDDPWAYRGPDSPFSEELRERFGPVDDDHTLAYDFRCGGCGAPVRLLFWIEERRGMGGPWFPEVKWVLELAESAGSTTSD